MTRKILPSIRLFLGFSITVREFKDLIKPIALRNWHYLFEKTIIKYDPSLNLIYSKLYEKKEFINEGRGAGILKPNRILSSSTGKVFEKIFFNDSPGLSRNLMFNESVSDRVSEKNIRYPEIREIIKGEKLTVILFEYLDLVRIPMGEEYDVLKATTFKMSLPQHETLVKDEIHYDRFNIGKQRLIETAAFSDKELLKLGSIVRSTPVCFQHFDLKEDNVFMGNIIIDWDNSGNYHLGADFGVLLLSLFVFHEDEFFRLYEDEIREYYEEVHVDISFEFFYITVLYHFLNLYYGYSSDKAHFEKILPVIKDCKSTLKNIILP